MASRTDAAGSRRIRPVRPTPARRAPAGPRRRGRAAVRAVRGELVARPRRRAPPGAGPAGRPDPLAGRGTPPLGRGRLPVPHHLGRAPGPPEGRPAMSDPDDLQIYLTAAELEPYGITPEDVRRR